MKRLFVCLIALACFSCKGKQEHTFTGTILLDEADATYTLTAQGSETTLTIVPDSTGRFSVNLPEQSEPFFNLYGVVEGENKWQFSTPVCLPVGKNIRCELHLSRGEAIVSVRDKDNRALQSFRDFYLAQSKKLWTNPPAQENIKATLDQYAAKAEAVIRDEHPGQETADYLRTWAGIEYLNACSALPFICSHTPGWVLPQEVVQGKPDIPQTLDCPYWYMFYGIGTHIMTYLAHQNDTLEARIRLLDEQFRTPTLREETKRQMLNRFVHNESYSEDGLSRLEALCTDLPDGKEIVALYRNKRFASIGAPIPDVTFEDKDGNSHRLSDFKGKYIYVDLWASWCGPCVAEVPHLQKLEKELKNKDVIFISISLDTKREDWEKKMEQLGMHGHQWHATSDLFSEMLNVKGIPHFLLYDKEGKLLEYKALRPSNSQLKAQLETLN